MSTNRELADEVAAYKAELDGAEDELAAAKAELAAAKTELAAAKATIVTMTSLAKTMLSTVELRKKPAKKKPAALTKGQELALKALGGTASGTDDDVPITARRRGGKRAKTNS